MAGDKGFETIAATTTPLRAVAIALTVSLGAVLPMLLTGALAVQIKADLGFGDTALGLALGSISAVSGLFALAGGRISDRVGWHRASLLASLLSALALLGVAGVARSYLVLVLFLVAGGTGAAVAMPTANLILARETPPHRRGLLFGFKQTAIPIGSLFAGLSIPTIALTIGWRWAFAAAAAMPLLAFVLVPSRARPSKAALREQRRGMPLLERKPLVLLAAAGSLTMLAVGALRSFVVVSSVEAGISESMAGLLLAVASIGGMAVRLVGGWLADRRHSEGFPEVAALIAAGGVGLALMATRVPALVAVGALVGYAAGWGWPGLFHYGLVRAHPHNAATATGVTQFGMATGSAIGPVMFGVVADQAGHAVAWSVAAAAAGLGAAAMLWAGGRLTRGVRTPR